MTCILLSREIGGVPVDVVILEQHKAEMEIADHPVESGAQISDHAWRKPYEVRMESIVDAPAAIGGWNALLAVQASAQPFSLVTGFKVYSNMLFKELEATRDKERSQILAFTALCREVIIASTASSGGAGGQGALGSSSSDGAKSTFARGAVQARDVTDIPTQSQSILSGAIRS